MKKSQSILLNSIRKKIAFTYIAKPENHIGRHYVTNQDDKELKSYYEYVYDEEFPKSNYGRSQNTDDDSKYIKSSFYQWDMWTPTYPGEVWDRTSLVMLFIMLSMYLNILRIIWKASYEDKKFDNKKKIDSYCKYFNEPLTITKITE